MKKSLFLLVAPATLLMASCSSNDDPAVVTDEVTEADVVAVTVLDAASQASRVTTYGRSDYAKWEKLQLVAEIAPVEDAKDNNWSATGIAADAEGNVYVTWHSDYQATLAATKWGGAVDKITVTDGVPNIVATISNNEMKFNNVLVENGKLYLSATSAKGGGAVGVVGTDIANASTIDRVGFPGASVNAIAKSGSDLIGVSGYSYGTYATFSTDAEATPYVYSTADVAYYTQAIKPVVEISYSLANKGPEANYFGGKDVKVVGSDVYILRQGQTSNAQILKNGVAIDLNFELSSGSQKDAESYDYSTQTWTLTSETSNHYGKHIMAIANGKAYVGAGANGLKVVDLSDGSTLWENEQLTTACYADGEYIYAATEQGLRVYEDNGNGELELVAYQVGAYTYTNDSDEEVIVKAYDEDGIAVLNYALGAVDEANSYNYVTKVGDYIYVACGQEGIKVFKWREEEGDEQ